MRLSSLITLGLLAPFCQGAVTFQFTQTANDAAWPSAPASYNNNSFKTLWQGQTGYGFYDAFSIQASGGANQSISSVTLGFHFSGLFDDSVGIDLNGDGTIDYALSYWNLYNTRRDYAPWISLDDATNLGIVLNITSAGTTATSYLYGQQVSTSGIGYVNNLTSINLASLGLSTLDVNGNATSINSIRVGFLNVDGIGGGSPTLSSNSFNYNPAVTYSGAAPEPSTYGLLLSGLALAVVAVRRRRKA